MIVAARNLIDWLCIQDLKNDFDTVCHIGLGSLQISIYQQANTLTIIV